jgi:hypothetical protein
VLAIRALKSGYIREGIMTERFGDLVGAVMVVLTLGGAACGYDRDSTPTGPGYGDSVGGNGAGYAISAAAGRSRFRVFSATGDIAATLAEFRDSLGNPPNGGTQGPLAGGRREIKWDGLE